MSTIPASSIVQVNPGVLSAGGTALQTNGMMLTSNPRVPIGQVLSFPSAQSVSTYFGGASQEALAAGGGTNPTTGLSMGQGYFGAYLNNTITPAAMLVAQYNPAGVSAYLRGGIASGYSLSQLQGLSGSLTVLMDGYTYTAPSINLSSASSFSAAAALIQAGLNASLPSPAAFTASLAAGAATSFTASIAGNSMYVTNVAAGALVVGGQLSGTGVTAGTQIDSQISGTPGGIGVYALNKTQVVASTLVTQTYGLLNVTGVSSGTLTPGQGVIGAGVSVGTVITAFGTGSGLTGTYIVNNTQTIASESMNSQGQALAVSFDSVSGAFVITSGSRGAFSLAAYATGTLSASLFFTQALGAVLSQGAAPASPATFMAAVTQVTQNWVSFWTLFDPDDLSGNVQKQAFANWVNTTNNRYAYICWDTDITPTLSTNAAASMGQILKSSNSSGTILVWEPLVAGAPIDNSNYAAFLAGMIASINYNAIQGRITLAFKGQSGLVATVTTQFADANLLANGYNFYGAFATANQTFLFLYNGTVSGEFLWADSYVDQIVLNNAFQLALMVLLTTINSAPYNPVGYAEVEAAMMDTITFGLNSGIIQPGVVLSSSQIEVINETSGGNVAPTVAQQGWVVVIQPASPQTRQARNSPTILFWYTDGESIQKIVLNSTDVQ